jgi:hypothetical protein
MGRWWDVKMDIKEVGWVYLQWINLAHDRVQWPSGKLKSGEFLDQLSNYSLLKKDSTP